MKDFSITRIPNNDLIGLFLPVIPSYSEYEIEVITPIYKEGYYIDTNGVETQNDSFCYGVADVKDFDYVLLPLSNPTSTYQYSSLVNAVGGQMTTSLVSVRCQPSTPSCAWALLQPTSGHPIAVVNMIAGQHVNIIGFRRHRSDNVNPRSPLRPEPIEIRERAELEPEPVPEIAEPDVEETPEEVEEE